MCLLLKFMFRLKIDFSFQNMNVQSSFFLFYRVNPIVNNQNNSQSRAISAINPFVTSRIMLLRNIFTNTNLSTTVKF